MTPAPWRTGRKLGRTLYERKYTDHASDEDRFLGIMDTPEDARRVADAVNAIARIRKVEYELSNSIDPNDHYAARQIRDAIEGSDDA